MSDFKFDHSARVLTCNEVCDLSDDYTLPDYMPAVGRVISCTASAAPPSVYPAGGSAELAGGVRYRMLYESAEDGSLWCAELPAEYDIFTAPDKGAAIPADPEDISGLIEACPENVTARITAPRRLTLRSRINLCGALCAPRTFETVLRGDAAPHDSLKTLTAESEFGACTTAASEPISLSDMISRSEAGLGPEDEIRIIGSQGGIMIKSIEEIGSSLECRGELCASVLYICENEGERPRRLTRKIPFCAAVALPAPEGDPVGIRAYGACPRITAKTDENGIVLEADALICAERAAAERITYLKDIYSQTAETEACTVPLALLTPVACFNANATISAFAELDSIGLDGGMKLCDYSAQLADCEPSISENGKFTYSGKLKIKCIADNGAELIPSEFSSDFKYTADIAGPSPAAATCSVIASLCDIKCRIDGGRISADCELCLAVKIEDINQAQPVSEVNFIRTAEPENSASRIIICYPGKGESLWDVAKRYRSDPEAVAQKNSLSGIPHEAPLAGTDHLII